MDKNKFVKEIEYENSNFTYYFLKLNKNLFIKQKVVESRRD